jgi:hypothetical protein
VRPISVNPARWNMPRVPAKIADAEGVPLRVDRMAGAMYTAALAALGIAAGYRTESVAE